MRFISLQLAVVMPIGLCTLTALELKLVHKHVARRGCVMWGSALANQRAVSARDGKAVFCCIWKPVTSETQNVDLDSVFSYVSNHKY